MLLTKKSEYALLSLISISKQKEPINVDILSKELQISKSFLAKIMQNLAKANLVISHRGVNGGFVLNKPIDELTILEIVVAAEEKNPMVFECSDAISSCPNNKPCAAAILRPTRNATGCPVSVNAPDDATIE